MESQYGNYNKFIKLFDDLSKQPLQEFTPYNVFIEELNLYFKLKKGASPLFITTSL